MQNYHMNVEHESLFKIWQIYIKVIERNIVIVEVFTDNLFLDADIVTFYR